MLSIGEYNQRLLKQIQESKDIYISMAKGTEIEYKLNRLYTDLTIAFRSYANSITSAILPTQYKPTTNIYFQDNKVVGVDHRDYEKEYWDKKRFELEDKKQSTEANLLKVIREIDTTLNSVPEIKKYRMKNPLPALSCPSNQASLGSSYSSPKKCSEKSQNQTTDKGIDKIVAIVILGFIMISKVFSILSNLDYYLKYGIIDLIFSLLCVIPIIGFIVSTFKQMQGKVSNTTGLKTVGFFLYIIGEATPVIFNAIRYGGFSITTIFYKAFYIVLVWVAVYKLEKWIKK